MAYQQAIRKGSAAALLLAKWGVCQLYLGQRDEGLEALRQAMEREPEFGELLDLVVLGAALVQENAFAASVACKRLRLEGASAFHYELACTLLRLSCDWDRHRAVVQEGLTKFPNNAALFAESGPAHTAMLGGDEAA